MNTSFSPSLLSASVTRRLLACTPRETSIIIGDDAFSNMQMSLQHAKLLLEKNMYDTIYYINLPFSKRRFTDTSRALAIIEDERLEVVHVSTGELATTLRSLEYKVDNGERIAVIINSWEMGSRTHRHREDLIFTLFRLVNQLELTFFVYCNVKSGSVTTGKSNRTGLGKLAFIATDVVDVATSVHAKKEEDEKVLYGYMAAGLEGEELAEFNRKFDAQQAKKEADLAQSEADKKADREQEEAWRKAQEKLRVGVNLVESDINELATPDSGVGANIVKVKLPDADYLQAA